jgi:hypothetical protein
VVPRLAATVALLFAATALLAQDAKTVKIEFAGEGEREVWMQSKGQHGTVPDKQSVSGKAMTLDLPEQTANKSVFVHDTKTGNVAVKPLADVAKAGSWTVAAKDEAFTYVMAFRVQHADKAVAAAIVRLKVGADERMTQLTPADEGVVRFFIVPYGDAEVTVDYKSNGEEKSLDPQTFEARAGMAGTEPHPLTISDDVETVAPAAPESTAEKAEPEEEKEEEAPRTNWFATLINMVIGLAVIGGIAYAVWRYVKANPDETADAFKKAGVAMPGADPGDPASTPKKTGPPQQIILTDATPTPSDTSFFATAAPAVKNPRLVKADGSVYIVMDGEQSVGREEGGGLALVGESSVSRTHAKLTRAGDAVTIEDAGSTNGTFVNGQRLSGPQALSHGDSVQFGAVQVRYEE